MSSRKWVFTINNFEDTDIELIKANESKYEYCIVGSEVAPTTGTKHLQGFIRFKSRAYKFKEVAQIVKGHLDIAKGTDKQNQIYCSKEQMVVYEFGQPKEDKQGKRNDLSKIKDVLMSGGTMRDVLPDISNYQQLKFAEGLLKYQIPVKNRDVKVVWIYGAPRTGKTKYAMRHAGDNYWISGKDLQWFDGYCGQKVVIIDEFRPSFCSFEFFLRLLDRYPIRVNVKGSSVWFQPDIIYITSIYSPQEIHDKYNTLEPIDQLLGRITRIKHIK